MTETNENPQPINNMARSASVLAVAMVFSQLAGLLSKSVIGSFFGASSFQGNCSYKEIKYG